MMRLLIGIAQRNTEAVLIRFDKELSE